MSDASTSPRDMNTLTAPALIRSALEQLILRRTPVRVHTTGGSTRFAVIEVVSELGFVSVRVDGPPPRLGAYVQVTGKTAGEAFGFVTTVLDTQDNGAWLMAMPSILSVRPKRKHPRIWVQPGMTLHLSVGSRLVEAELFDLGEGGLAFSARHFPTSMAIGVRVGGLLDLPRTKRNPVQLDVRHLRGLRCGAKFLSIPRAAALELRRLAEGTRPDLPEISLGT